MTLLTAAFLLACLATGLGLTGYLPLALRLEERLPIAAVVGAMAVTLASLITIAGLGFGGDAVVMALMLAAMIAGPGLMTLGPSLRAEWSDFRSRLAAGWRDPSSPMPLLVLCAVSWPLAVRILGLAYQPTSSGGIAAGHLSTFGDWQAHLAYAGNFAYRDELNLTTPLSAGDDLAYHFGVDLFAALAVPTGASLPAALQITSGYFAFAFVPLLYLFGRRLFERRGVAVGGTVLFLMAGGWGFMQFFDDVGAQAGGSYLSRVRSVFWNQPRDYTRDFDQYFMDNPVLGHLFPQRPTLVGFAVVLFGLALLWSARQSDENGVFAWVGVVVGLTPIFHTFGWGTTVVMGAVWALTDLITGRPWRRWLWFLGPAVLLALPAIAWLLPPSPGNGFRWHWGWVTDGSAGDLIRFWFLNTGFFPALFIAALVWRGAVERRLAVALAPIWLWWIGVHLALPHPWEGNNSKYAIFWWMIGSFAIAALFGALLDRFNRPDTEWRYAVVVMVGATTLTLVAAGGLDLVKAIDGTAGVFPAEIASAEGRLVGEWARRSTADDAVFVNSSSSTSQPIASLGGRAVVAAFDGWVFDLGLDWFVRAQASRTVLAGGPDTALLIEQYSIDYVVIGPRELSEGASPEFWDASATLVYDIGGYRVYELAS